MDLIAKMAFMILTPPNLICTIAALIMEGVHIFVERVNKKRFLSNRCCKYTKIVILSCCTLLDITL